MTGSDEYNHSLAAKLAATTARLLIWVKDEDEQTPGHGKAGEFTNNGYQLDLEIPTEVMGAMGVAEPWNAIPGKVVACVYRLNMDVEDIQAFVEGLAPVSMPPFDKVLSAFLGLAYLRGVIKYERDAIFSPPTEYHPIMDELVGDGYAVAADGLYSWTEKVRPAMRIQHKWPAEAR